MKITLPWYVYAIAGLLAISGGALALNIHDAKIRREALAADSLKIVHATETRIGDSLAKNAVVLHTDTVRIEHWTPIYKTIRDTVLKNVHDTVAVVQFVHAADSTILACSQLVSDCQARVSILSQQVAAVSAERDIYRKQAPTFLMRNEGAVCTATGVLGAVGGILLGRHL